MIDKKMITIKLNNSRLSSYDNLGIELKELKREIIKQLKEKKVGKNNDLWFLFISGTWWSRCRSMR